MDQAPQSNHRGGVVAALAPWIVYWVLIGNIDFRVALLIALGVAALHIFQTLQSGDTPKLLDLGTLAAFAALVIVAYATNDTFLERWIQPLANGALFAIALGSILIGKPFVLQYAREGTPPEVAESPAFLRTVSLITWVWVVAFGVMFVSALIPPIADGNATFLDQNDTLGIVFYWVLPILALVVAIVFTKWYPERVRARAREAATA